MLPEWDLRQDATVVRVEDFEKKGRQMIERAKLGIRAARWFAALSMLLASTPAWADEAASNEGAAPTPAAAEPPPPPAGPHTANSLQLGVGFRYGAMVSDGEPNPWATGLGLDVGYTLPQAVYLGASFEYFFGGSVDLGLGVKAKSNIWQLSAEGGYDVGLGENFVIRPKVGLGIASAKSSVDGCPTGLTCPEAATKTKPLVAPGVTFMLFTEKVSVALDVRYALVLADPSPKAVIFAAGVGF